MLAGEGLRWQWLPSTQGPYWEEGSSGFSFLAAGLEQAVWWQLPGGGSNVPPGKTGLGTHFLRPCMGCDSSAPSWREGVGGVSGSSCGECLPCRWMSQMRLGLCSASLPAALVSCGLGRGWGAQGMGEGV